MTRDRLYPLLLERKLSPRLWGGRRLQNYLHLDLPPGAEPIGEAWQVYADNTVINGSHAGKTLQQVVDESGEALLGSGGRARSHRPFPLLAKFIDAAEKLSIQVHPDDHYAFTREVGSGFSGKAEAWLILAAEPGAAIIRGFNREVIPAEVRQAVNSGTLEHLLRAVPVQPGDVIYNPAGTVHAVGAGIFLFEIQQTSDLTYRLYDYQRRDVRGRLRELHLDKALEVADLSAVDGDRVVPVELPDGWLRLVACEHFIMESRRLSAASVEASSGQSVVILTVTEGLIRLEWAEGKLTLEHGASVVIPAALGAYALEGDGLVVRCYLPTQA